MQRTRLSSKGQIILPKSIRDSQGWKPGMEFVLEETDKGVLLRPASVFPPTELDEVVGRLASDRKPATSEEMRQAVAREVRRRYDRGRY